MDATMASANSATCGNSNGREPSKHPPTFHIGQAGNLNTGNITIHGDQVGIQHNYALPQDLAQAAKDIRDLLQQLDLDYATYASFSCTTTDRFRLQSLRCA